MRALVCIGLLLIASGIRIPDERKDRSVFGVRVAMGPNSQLTSFIAIRYSYDGILREKRNYSQSDFIRILSGDWPSIFNPTKKNLFQEHGIVGGVYYNDTIKKSFPYCPVFDSLWKLRYSDYPMRNGSEKGWSNGLYKPTSNQEIFLLEVYHLKQMDFDYVTDTNFWALLRDMSDTVWIKKYKAIQ